MSIAPNILLILTDQQRQDTIRALGNDRICTPALDRLVAEGTTFTRAYSPSPECVPARCCLTYGQYPAQTRCYGNGWHYPSDDRQTFMGALTAKGYRTHGIGKYHFEYADYAEVFAGHGFQTREIQEEICSWPEKDDYLQYLWKNGFGEITDPHGVRGDMYYLPQPAMMPQKHHPTQWVGDRATAFLRDQAQTDQPWYGYVSFIHPHPPFCPPSPWHKLYRDVDMPDPHLPACYEDNWIYLNHLQNRYKRYDKGYDRHRLRMIRAYYYACISFVDYQVGCLLQTLDETGQADNTLVIFTSDHGELLGDFGSVGKRSFHEPSARVPLILRQPGVIPANQRCRTPVDLIDVTKTILTAASTDCATHRCEGEDLVALGRHPERDRVICTQLYAAERGVYTSVDRRGKYVYSAPDQKELYFDLAHDPGESTNRIAATDPATVAHRDYLKQTLLNHLRTHREDTALDGSDWKAYPLSMISPNPDDHLLYQDHPWVKPHPATAGYQLES